MAAQVSFEVHAEATAVGVALESELPGHFTHNALHIVPWQPVTVSFISASDDVSADALQGSLTMQVWNDPCLKHGSKRLQNYQY